MKKLICEMCGSTDVIKQEGFFTCQVCGMKYSVEDAKKMMIEGTVDVQGTVKVDNSSFIEKYLRNAHRALEKEDWEEVEKYYNMVEQNSNDNMEAVFFSSYGRAMLSMTDSDYFKREQKFKVLNKSMSVISDYYETTMENKEEVLRKISLYIKRMSYITYVYNRQSLNITGAIRAATAVTGSKKWCENLINSTKQAFINELREIAEKHDEEFIKNLIEELDPTPSVPAQEEIEKKEEDKVIKGTGLGFVLTFCLGVIGLLIVLFLGDSKAKKAAFLTFDIFLIICMLIWFIMRNL